MRGPAYPPDAAFHREQSHEFGSPTPSYIDPSLTAPPYAQQSFYPNGDLHLAHSPVLVRLISLLGLYRPGVVEFMDASRRDLRERD